MGTPEEVIEDMMLLLNAEAEVAKAQLREADRGRR